jgi:hypothetical protein
MGAERVEGTLLVGPHQPAIAGDIGGEDCGKLAFHDKRRPSGQEEVRAG